MSKQKKASVRRETEKGLILDKREQADNSKSFMVNVPEKLWELANIITGFSVVQTIAYLYSIGLGDITAEDSEEYGFYIFGAVVFFHILYMGSVWLCHWKMIRLAGVGPAALDEKFIALKKVSRWLMWGQLFVIGAFGVFATYVTGVVVWDWRH